MAKAAHHRTYVTQYDGNTIAPGTKQAIKYGKAYRTFFFTDVAPCHHLDGIEWYTAKRKDIFRTFFLQFSYKMDE